MRTGGDMGDKDGVGDEDATSRFASGLALLFSATEGVMLELRERLLLGDSVGDASAEEEERRSSPLKESGAGEKNGTDERSDWCRSSLTGAHAD